MFLSTRVLTSVLLTLSIFFFQSCFPTKSDEKQDEQEVVDPIETDIKSDDLPENIDPKFVVSENSIDSLFNVLVKRVESLENVEAPDDVFNYDFASIQNGFATAISKQPSHAKANVGFIISSICALNTSNNIKKAVDSIQSYIEDVDSYYYEEDPYSYDDDWYYDDFLAKRKILRNSQLTSASLKKQSSSGSVISNIYKSKGIEGLGYVLLAQTPQILVAQTKKPSFPSFLTINFIQKTVEDDIIPRLNEVLSACKRLEQNNISLSLTSFDETFELDNGDILLFEAGIRLVRAGLGLFTTYNMDFLSSDGSHIVNTINSYEESDYSAQRTYKFRNDTLICLNTINEEHYSGKIADLVQYNLKRSDFLKIRQANHEWVYNDLKMVPELIKSSLKSMKEETDDQDDDLIAAGNIFDITSDMADISSEMQEKGFSPSLASRFVSPEALMDFVTEILTKEYTFSESIDGYNIEMTINISKWFTNPVNDLKTLFPKYRFSQKQDRITSYTDKYYENWSDNTIYVDPEDIIDIPETMITSSEEDNWGKVITLAQDYSVTLFIDSVIYCSPLFLIDDAGKDIPQQETEDIFYYKQALKKYFPYFNDYTVNGVFPRMTSRSAWIDFLSQFYEQ